MALKKKMAVFSLIFVFAVSTVILSSFILGTTDARSTGSTADENDNVAPAPINEIETVPDEEPKAAFVGKEWTGNGNNLDLNLLQVGDIIAVKGVIKLAGFAEWYMGYSHVAIYIGNGEMVEAFSDGVRIAPSSMIHNADCAELIRVSTTTSKKQAAVNFMLQQVGKPYDYQWLTWIGGKEVYGSSYYCSELAWAGYQVAGGPDIDQNPGWSWRYGYSVAPQENVDDSNTYTVSYSS